MSSLAELDELRRYLAEAKRARQDLMIGDKEVEVMAFGRKRTFFKTSLPDLKEYIEELKADISEIEAVLGITSTAPRRGGAIGFSF